MTSLIAIFMREVSQTGEDLIFARRKAGIYQPEVRVGNAFFQSVQKYNETKSPVSGL